MAKGFSFASTFNKTSFGIDTTDFPFVKLRTQVFKNICDRTGFFLCVVTVFRSHDCISLPDMGCLCSAHIGIESFFVRTLWLRYQY